MYECTQRPPKAPLRVEKHHKGQRKQSSKKKTDKKTPEVQDNFKKKKKLMKYCWDEMGTNKYFSSTGLCSTAVNIKISHPIRVTPFHIQTWDNRRSSAAQEEIKSLCWAFNLILCCSPTCPAHSGLWGVFREHSPLLTHLSTARD